jgi:hypothetical protein
LQAASNGLGPKVKSGTPRLVGRTIAQVTGAARSPSGLAAATCFRVDPKDKIIDAPVSAGVARKHLCQARPGRQRRNATTTPPPRATSPPTPTRIGRGIPGAAPQRDYGQRSRGNTGAPTPIPFGITKARRSGAICAVPASRKMIAAHAIACGDIKRKHSGGSHATRCPLLKRTAGGAGR